MNKYMVSFTCTKNGLPANGNNSASAKELTMDAVQAWERLLVENDPSLSSLTIMNVVRLDG